MRHGISFYAIFSMILTTMIIMSVFRGFSQISVKPQSTDSYEPNNSEAQATVIHISETQTHSIDPASDVDFFQITVDKSQFVVVSFQTTGSLDIQGLYTLSQIHYSMATATTSSFQVYINPNQKNIFKISGPNIVDSYSVSIGSGGTLADKNNHENSTSYDMKLTSDISDVLNYTNSYESDWYTFNISTPTTIRAMLGITPLPGMDIVKMELFNENLTELAISYRTFTSLFFEATILAKLDAGTYYLKITTTKTSNVGIFIYDLTLTTSISSHQYMESYHSGHSSKEYKISGTVIPSTPININIDPWDFGTFQTELLIWNNNSVTYSIADTPIINSNTSELGFTTAKQLHLSFSSSNHYADFILVITQYLPDYFDQHSSQQNPFELHKDFNGGYSKYNTIEDYQYGDLSGTTGDPTINYPTEVDWWKFTPPISGELNITFKTPVKLNITLYYANRTKLPIIPTVDSNDTTFDFGDINSTVIFSVALFNPQELYTSYIIHIRYLNDNPITRSGSSTTTSTENSKSGSSESGNSKNLVELGVIFGIGIIIMIIIQYRIKHKPKDNLNLDGL